MTITTCDKIFFSYPEIKLKQILKVKEIIDPKSINLQSLIDLISYAVKNKPDTHKNARFLISFNPDNILESELRIYASQAIVQQLELSEKTIKNGRQWPLYGQHFFQEQKIQLPYFLQEKGFGFYHLNEDPHSGEIWLVGELGI